ncbi:MAG: cation-transporting P-type ATPase [Gammaproteobacteria bacterium]|nr:cation-transporting P-type ATPase [Gammaproteobacteria bacterium]
MDREAVMQGFGVTLDGLSDSEAARRLGEHGPNQIPPPPKRSALLRLLAHFHNVLIYVLLCASAVTAWLGHLVDSSVILGVVLVNGAIGFIQEGKAERALDAVRGMLSAQAMVVRGGRRITVSAEDLVPGDLVFVQSGDRVPADLRLIKCKDLHVDEAILTGESVPAEKLDAPQAMHSPLGDRRNMAFSGTFVTFGQGTGVVVSSGADTEIGRISAMLSQVRTLSTPLTRQLAFFGRWLTAAIMLIALATLMFGVLVQGYGVDVMFLAAVGLAVAAIPEGLPAIITITLAIGVQRMARRNAIIRRLPAVETLGSVTVICSDKTGTLTRNEMTVQSVVMARGEVAVTGAGYDPHGSFSEGGVDLSPIPAELLDLCKAALLCNDATVREREGVWGVDGDPTEGALIVLGIKAGFAPQLLIEEVPRTDVIPFESQHLFMATLHHDHLGHGMIFVKGAPEAILSRCRWERGAEGDRPLTAEVWMRWVERIAKRGQRTLAIAMKAADPGQQALCFDDITGGLTLLGLVGIIDPPRQEAVASVQRCQAAGITVKMITGDHASTAAAIAERMGIGRGRAVVTGADLDRLDNRELTQLSAHTDVFARATPEHKLRLVEALQSRGEVVAMTGDGVNDAPALKRADVGVAMGIKGTEAAKEASEMVLVDDNFASISHAVEEGRTVYDNIKKSILFILPTNGGEALTILAAVLFGKALPVTAAQILWVNMITAVTLALSLAFEPAESAVMGRMPRNSKEPLLTPFMNWRILFVSVLMVVATFGLFLWERLNGADLETARTVAVNTLVVAEVFYLLNTRYFTASVINREGIMGNPYLLLAIVSVMVFQLLFTYLPVMQVIFLTTALDAGAWARVILAGLAVFALVEIEKAIYRSLVAR